MVLPELCSSCPVPRPPAIKAVLNWSQGLVFGPPCGNSLEDLRPLQDLLKAVLMGPSPCHTFHHRPGQKPHGSTERHFCCSRDSKNAPMQMCLGFASILEPKAALCLPFSGCQSCPGLDWKTEAVDCLSSGKKTGGSS